MSEERVIQTCDHCKGSGAVEDGYPCPDCNGKGYNLISKELYDRIRRWDLCIGRKLG